MKRPALTICATLAMLSAHAQVHPLEQATYEATRLCSAVDPAGDHESCGNMIGRSAEHSAARRALIRMHNERTKFMSHCLADKPISDCTAYVDWLMIGGFSRAVEDAYQQTMRAR